MVYSSPPFVKFYPSHKTVSIKTLYRLYNEPPHTYLLRVKFLCDPASGRNEAILPDIEEAFTEFIDSRPNKRKFIQVCGNLVLTSSMLWDIMQYRHLKTW